MMSNKKLLIVAANIANMNSGLKYKYEEYSGEIYFRCSMFDGDKTIAESQIPNPTTDVENQKERCRQNLLIDLLVQALLKQNGIEI